MTETQFHDPEYLRREHHDKQRSVRSIAREHGVDYRTIQYHMRKHGIERRDRLDSSGREIRKEPASHDWSDGYERVSSSGKEARVHQLIAIANGEDPYKVFSNKEWQCHHLNQHKADNRHGNIVVVPKEYHGKLTDQERFGGSPWRDKDTLARALAEGGSDNAASDILGCGSTTVQRWRGKHGL